MLGAYVAVMANTSAKECHVLNIKMLMALFVVGSLCALRPAPARAASVVGTSLNGFKVFDSTGRPHSLNEYQGKVIVLALWSFKCPVSLASDRRLNDLVTQYGNRGVIVLGIDPNSDESAEAVEKNAANLNLGYPVMLDPEGVLVDRLAASHIPTIFVADRDLVIRYAGAIDNNKRPGERDREAYVEQALDAILAGKPVAVSETKTYGCSIKRRTP
jgi:peroxiredoxin